MISGLFPELLLEKWFDSDGGKIAARYFIPGFHVKRTFA
jgi:hypothetical protein